MADIARYEAALSKGHSYSWEQQWQEAIQAFESALQEFSDKPAPYAGLGNAYFSLNQVEKALHNYKLAARYSRGDVIYLRQVADMQEQLGHTQEAGQTYMAIGEIFLRRNNTVQAVQNWQRAARLEPMLLGARQRLAKYYTSQKQLPPAIEEYLAIARIYQAGGEDRKAYQTLKAALHLDPRNTELLTALDLVQQGVPLPAPRATPAGNGNQGPLPGLDGHSVFSFGGDQRRNGTEEAESSPVVDAQQLALSQLAEEVFTDDIDNSTEDTLTGRGQLSKAERDALLTQALDFQTRGLTNEAINAYEKVISGGVASHAAHFNLGLLYQEKLRFDDAIRELSISVQDPEFRLGSHFALGECFRARGQIDQAITHFILVLQIVDLPTVQHDQANRLIELYEHLADSLKTKGERDQATAFANALVEFLSHPGWADKVKEARTRLDALSGDQVMILGDILAAGSEKVLESLYLTREFESRHLVNSAIEEVYRAISASPDYLPAHIRLAELLAHSDLIEAAVSKYIIIGDTFQVRGDINGAISMYEQVVEISPLDFSIRSRLVEMLKQHGQIDRSLHHYLALGEAYYQFAQVDKARETYQQALKLAPQGSAEKRWRFQLLRRIADIDLQRFSWRQALLAYRELRQEDPTDDRTALTMIDLYFKVGQANLALRELDLYLKQLIQAGGGAKVPEILEDMVRRYPTSVGLVQRLVRLHLAQKKPAEAIAALDRLGEAQLDAGQVHAARATIEYIIRLNPPNVGSYRQLIRQLDQQAA